MRLFFILTIFASIAGSTLAYYKDPHYFPNKTTLVHLFEWKWTDIAKECENFLGPKGYGGVQVSPVNENLIISSRPWWERYQPISYEMKTRSGNETQFADMVKRCNFAGVRIYVDVILNHMTGNNSFYQGTSGNVGHYENFTYPGVAYENVDFNHPICIITNYQDPFMARNCELLGLRDLNQTSTYVRNKMLQFLNKLIDMGVAGFRIDAAKHMWPADLKVIYERLHDLNVDFGFPQNSRPFIYQEVIDLEAGDISKNEYTPLGAVTEYRAGLKLGNSFRGISYLSELKNWANGSSLVESWNSLVFNENHDNQRGHGVGEGIIINYKTPKIYRAALAFLLAHPYGNVRLMSSFAFNDSDAGPPMDNNENIISPGFDDEGACTNGWVCEHRWPAIYEMVEFRNQVNGTALYDWWDNGANQIYFTRFQKGFIAINMETTEMNRRLYTRLPTGTYCDVMTGGVVDGRCAGKILNVDATLYTNVIIRPTDAEYVVAIHTGPESRLN